MDLIYFVEENKTLITIIAGLIIVLAITIFLFKIEGLISLLGKAIGTVLQQICSLIIEAICLVFKIINSLEIYIVLLIDVLTGKISSDKKIASLAIGVLSIASFYTTYTGMEFFVNPDQFWVSILITLGIQAILLSTSLRINDFLNLDAANQNFFTTKKLILATGIICSLGCFTAYLLKVFNLSYSLSKILYHILYLIVIVSALMVVFLLIMELIKTGFHHQNTGVFLFAIYFAVLCVSSFFSYNAFVSVMYPDSIRNIDSFQKYRLGALALMERADRSVDVSYYENIKAEMESELRNLEQQIASLTDSDFLSPEELALYKERTKFEQYIANVAKLEALKKELATENEKWTQEEATLFNNSGGVGPNTRTIWTEKKALYEQRIKPLQEQIDRLNNDIGELDADFIQEVEAYVKMLDKIEAKRAALDCTAEIVEITTLLNQSKWLIDDNHLYSTILKLEQAEAMLSNEEKSALSNNLWDMLQTYHSYLMYINQYSDIKNEILGISLEQELYTDAYLEMQKYLYEFLQLLPETQYVFYSTVGTTIQTRRLPISDYYSTAETLKRNANPDLSLIEKNIRTFIDNKLVGIVCALMALLIDMMILFVGIILPKDIHLKSSLSGKYSEQEIRRILSNLFNKPIRR